MKFRVYKALARGVVLESIRRKDLWVVAILGFIIVLASGALGFFGISGLEIFAKDLAATVLGAFSTIIAVLTSTRMMPDEIKQRTLYPLLSRPISRFDLLVGKLAGSVIVTWISFLILSALVGFALLVLRMEFQPIMLQYLLAKMMGLVIVCGVGLFLSCIMTPAAAATMSFVLLFGTSMIVRGLSMAIASAGAETQVLFKVINAILPQTKLFDLSGRVIYPNWSAVELWVMLTLAAYMVCYTSSMLFLSWLKFRKQAV